jgi:multiple sugar transport system substrate-binding protein
MTFAPMQLLRHTGTRLVNTKRVGCWALVAAALGLAGCWSRKQTTPANAHPFLDVSLHVAALGDTAILDTIKPQKGDWEERQKARVSIRSGMVDPAALEGIDLLFFPAERLGELVDRNALAVIPEAAVRPPAAAARADRKEQADPLAFGEILPAFRDEVSRYGEDRMGLPFGGSALVLVFRRDAFEAESNKSAAREAGVTLEPPKTWDQLDRLAQFFRGRDWDGDGQPDAAIALAWGADPEGVGNAVLLARAASIGQRPDQFSFAFDTSSLEPRIAAPPFVEALAALVALAEKGPSQAKTFDAAHAREAFRSASVALLIDRAERASQWTDPTHPRAVGVAALPGSERLYDPDRSSYETVKPPNRPTYLPLGGGWLVGIPRSVTGEQLDAALDFAKDLIGAETSARILADRSFPMLPMRGSQLASGLPDPRNAPGVEPRQWGAAVSETLGAARVIPGLRIPGADGYLADLDRARVAAVDGEPAERALQTAAAAWRERTTRLGRERQLWHYRRSLYLQTTSPNPPPREEAKP